MDKYNKLQELEINFQAMNKSYGSNNLWVYDMLGFIYAHMTDEQATELLARSQKMMWEYEQSTNQSHELEYEIGADK